MSSLRATNWFLLAILTVLCLDLGVRLAERPAVAETFQLDHCITAKPNDKPEAYLHTVHHTYTGP